MAAGASQDVGFWLRIGPGANSGTLSTRVQVTTTVSTVGELQVSNNVMQTELWVENRANLRVRSASFTDPSNRPIAFARVGDDVVFTGEIETVGPVASLPGVGVFMEMPGARIARLGRCGSLSSPVSIRCPLPILPPGRSTSLRVTFEIQPFALPVGQATALLTATATILDLSGNKGGAALTVADRLRPDLRVARASFTDLSGTPVTSAYVNDVVVFEVLIENVGTVRSDPGEVDTSMEGASPVWRNGMTNCRPYNVGCHLLALDVGEARLVRVAFRVNTGGVIGIHLTANAVVRQRDMGRHGTPETVLWNNTGSARLRALRR
jgi:hypothetical protein